MKRYKKILGTMMPSTTGNWVTYQDYEVEVKNNALLSARMEERDHLVDDLEKQLEETSSLLRRIVDCFPPSFLKEQCELLNDIVLLSNIEDAG